MASKAILLLFVGVVLGCAEPQAGDPSLPGPLSGMLSETEKQSILKERNPKSHVKSALKVAEARMKNAFQLAQQNKIHMAAQEMDAFLALITYADTYTRKTLASKIKDRNYCLKRIEQAIFKQSRSLESVARALPLESRETAESQIEEVKKIRLRAIDDLLGGGQVIDSSN